MPLVNQNHEITPFLNPEYWNGHSLGYGDVTPLTPQPGTARSASEAERAILLHVVERRGVLPGVPLAEDEEFNARDHDPQTVLALQLENLHTHGDEIAVDADEFGGVPLPERPRHYEQRDILDRNTGRHYESVAVLGAVARAGFSRRPVIFARATDSVELQDEQLLVRGIPFMLPSRFAIGQTLHTRPHALIRVASGLVYPPQKPRTHSRNVFAGLPKTASQGT